MLEDFTEKTPEEIHAMMQKSFARMAESLKPQAAVEVDVGVMAAVNINAGPGDEGWNDRFLKALDDKGLMLSRMPKGTSQLAPQPYPLGNQYPYPSYIVPKE